MTTSVYVRNNTHRRGVPLTPSFTRWIDAIPELRNRRCTLNILIVGSAEGRRFNHQFRHKDYATNVLSFTYTSQPQEKSNLLGDLVICAPVVAREAAEQGKHARDHYAHLSIHGVLHLLGYDHEKHADAQRMESLEIRILGALGIADPYS